MTPDPEGTDRAEKPEAEDNQGSGTDVHAEDSAHNAGPLGSDAAPPGETGGGPSDEPGPDMTTGPAGAAGKTDDIGSELAAVQEEVLQLQDDLARRKAELYNLQQEYTGYVRRSKTEFATYRERGVAEVAEVLLSVLDDVDLARKHGDLSGPAGSIGEKLETTLATNVKLVRFGAPGDVFDPERHEALTSQPDPEVEVETVFDVVQPGYMLGDKVLRAARVAVSTPA